MAEVTVQKIEKVEGNANIAQVRGRARYMYEWSFKLKLTVLGFKCNVEVNEACNDQLDDLDLAITWSKSSPPDKDRAKQLKQVITSFIKLGMEKFEEEFRSIGSGATL
jgi:hypothetical protein